MKSILIVIDSLHCGGAEKSLVSLLPLLDCRKYRIHLWILHRGGVFEKLVPSSVDIIANPCYSTFEKVKLYCARKLFSVIIRIFRKQCRKHHGAEVLWRTIGTSFKVPSEEYDVAIAYQQGFPTYLLADKVKAKKKYAWVNANIVDVGYDTKFNQLYYSKLDKIIAVSDALCEILKKEYVEVRNKFITIYDILNPDLVRSMSLQSVKEQKLNRLCLTTVARLVPLKGYDLLIEAATILKKRGVDFIWYIIGEGNERNNIERMIKTKKLENNVLLLGLKENPYPYMQMCDIYVQTSRYEGYGLSISEAKILHKPVVSTNFEVVYNQIVPEKNGLIADMEGEAIANCIEKLYQDHSLRNHIIGNLKLEHNSTYKTELKKIEDLFDEN